MTKQVISRRAFLRGAGLTSLGLGLAMVGCQPQVTEVPATAVPATAVPEAEVEAEETEPTPAPAEKVTVRYSVWWPVEGSWTELMFAAFQEKNPNIEMKGEQEPWGTYWEKFLATMAGGEAADYLAVSDQYFASFVRKDIFLPVDDLIARDGVDMAGFVVDQTMQVGYEGKCYGFGNFISDSCSMYANKALTDAAGIELPEFGTDAFWTWSFDDLAEAAKACTKVDADGTAEQWGFTGIGPSFWQGHGQLMWGNGGELYDTPPMYMDETEATITTPEVIETYQWIVDLYLKHKVAPTTSEVELLGEAGAWLSGKVAFVAGWNGYSDWNKANWEWACMPFPHNGHKCTMMGSNMNLMNKNIAAEKLEAAWAYEKFQILEEEGRVITAQQVLPGPYKPEEMLQYAPTEHQRNFWEQFIARLDVDCFRPKWFGSVAPQQFVDTMNEFLDPAFRGDTSVEEALQGAKMVIDPILAAGG